MSISTPLTDKQQIECLIKERFEAVKSQDIAKATAASDNDLLIFDVVGELSATGIQKEKERLKDWFASMQKLVNYETNIIDLHADHQLAYCNLFNHIVAVTKDNKDLNMWWRETLCFKKQSGVWKIASIHSSVPFDGESGKALTQLKPSKV